MYKDVHHERRYGDAQAGVERTHYGNAKDGAIEIYIGEMAERSKALPC